MGLQSSYSFLFFCGLGWMRCDNEVFLAVLSRVGGRGQAGLLLFVLAPILVVRTGVGCMINEQ